jgi:hypothetical protein
LNEKKEKERRRKREKEKRMRGKNKERERRKLREEKEERREKYNKNVFFFKKINFHFIQFINTHIAISNPHFQFHLQKTNIVLKV